jgi:hypothetical protein
MQDSRAGLKMPLAWPWQSHSIVERLKLVLYLRAPGALLTINRIAILPAPAQG